MDSKRPSDYYLAYRSLTQRYRVRDLIWNGVPGGAMVMWPEAAQAGTVSNPLVDNCKLAHHRRSPRRKGEEAVPDLIELNPALHLRN